MTISKFLSTWLLVLVIIGISGCSTTLYESLPVGKTTTCDPAWPGHWQAVKYVGEEKGDDAWIEINADCTTITTPEAGKPRTEAVRFEFVSAHAGDYLWVSDSDRKRECVGSDGTHCGFALIRYVRSGDEIRLFNPDHAKVHAAIAGRSVPGYTEISSDPAMPASSHAAAPAVVPAANASSAQAASSERHDSKSEPRYQNQITGNAEQIATILEQHPEFFESEPWMILRRAGPVKQEPHQ